MKRIFFKYTAFIEALTGLGLIFIPLRVTLLLFGAELTNNTAIILAMIGGSAIFSVALLSWLSKSDAIVGVSLPILLFYNIAVSIILLYASLVLDFKGIPLYVVITFHLFQSVVCSVLLKKQKQATK